MSDFRHPELEQLTDQLAGTKKRKTVVPVAKRREQLERAGQLLGEIDPAKNYPDPFVCYRGTRLRTDAHRDLLIPGSDLVNDLRLLVDRLDRSLPALPADEWAEPVLTLEEISKQLKVSAKTLRRWKQRHNLVGR